MIFGVLWVLLLLGCAYGQNVVTEMSSNESVTIVGRHRLKFYALDRGRPDHEAHECVVLFSGELYKADTCFAEDAPVLLAHIPDRIDYPHCRFDEFSCQAHNGDNCCNQAIAQVCVVCSPQKRSGVLRRGGFERNGDFSTVTPETLG
jgi:hypothetical protein